MALVDKREPEVLSAATTALTVTDLTYAQKKTGQRLMVFEGSLWSIMNAVAAPGGLVLTAFALYLKADALIIGLVSALPLLAALVQLWTPQMFAMFGGRKAVCVITLSTARLLLIPLTGVAIAAWLLPELASVWMIAFLTLITAFAGLTAIGGTTWLSWAGTVVPIEKRNDYFARRNVIIGAIGLVGTLAAGSFLDWWVINTPSGKTAHPAAYAVLLAIASVFGIWTVFVLKNTPDLPNPPKNTQSRPRLRDSLLETWQYTPLRRYLIFRACWMFAVTMVVPYYTVYLLQNLRLSFTEISVLSNIGVLVGLLSTPFWGKILTKFGCSRVVYWSCWLKVLYVAGWAFVLPGQSFIPLVVLHLTLVIDAGLNLAMGNLLMNLMPSQDARNIGFFSVHSAVISVAGAVGPFIAGLLISGLGNGFHWWIMGAIQLMFLLSAVLRIVALLFYRGIPENVRE
jgi:MFS family permease